MREIKFRAWVISSSFIQAEPHMAIQGEPDLETLKSFMHHYAGQKHLMQYTGLKDKNGKEIYEGDILLEEDSRIPYGPVSFGEVYVDKDDFGIQDVFCGWYVEYADKSGFIPIVKDGDGNYGLGCNICEIIGNIFENPELIK